MSFELFAVEFCLLIDLNKSSWVVVRSECTNADGVTTFDFVASENKRKFQCAAVAQGRIDGITARKIIETNETLRRFQWVFPFIRSKAKQKKYFLLYENTQFAAVRSNLLLSMSHKKNFSSSRLRRRFYLFINPLNSFSCICIVSLARSVISRCVCVCVSRQKALIFIDLVDDDENSGIIYLS